MIKVTTVTAVGLAVACAIGIAGCSSTPAKSAQRTVATAGSTGSTGNTGNSGACGSPGENPCPTTTTSTLPPIGSALSTTNVTVTLQQIIDPAQSNNEFEVPDAGDRFVAIKVVIDDTGTAQLSNDANSTFSLLGSDDQVYSASFESVAGCTNFNDGLYQLAPSQSVTGCVIYSVPTTVTISQVQYTDTIAHTRATWAGLTP